MKFYYYKGDWKIGKELLLEVEASTLTEADKLFEEKTGIKAEKDKSITVILKPIDEGTES